MTLQEFKTEIENGNLTEAYSSLIVDDIIPDEVIYEIAFELNNATISATAIVMLFSYLLEKPKTASKESAFRLAMMILSIPNNYSIAVEFFTRPVMSLIHETMITLLPEQIKKEVLLLIHCWRCHYGGSPMELAPITDLYTVMIAEGFKFPADSMVIRSAGVPEWIEGTECTSCKSKFSTFNRKHHCRNCGNIFCGSCSSKQRPLPQLLIKLPSRVCDSCDSTLEKNKRIPGVFGVAKCTNITDSNFLSSPTAVKASVKKHEPPAQTEDEFDLALKKAVELSLKEAEEDKKRRTPTQPTMTNKQQNTSDVSTPIVENPKTTLQNISSYPIIDEHLTGPSLYVAPSCPPKVFSASVETDKDDPTILLNNFRETIQQLNDKMKEVQSVNKSIALNPSVQTLMKAAMGMNNGLIEITQMNQHEIDRYEGYLAKIHQIETARATYDDMCRMHSKKVQEQKIEAEYLIRMHMEQKMHLLRQQQLEFEEYQKNLNETRRQKFDYTNQINHQLPSIPTNSSIPITQSIPTTQSIKNDVSYQPQYIQQNLPPNYQYSEIPSHPPNYQYPGMILQQTPIYPFPSNNMYQQPPTNQNNISPQMPNTPSNPPNPNPNPNQPKNDPPGIIEELISFDK